MKEIGWVGREVPPYKRDRVGGEGGSPI